MKLLTAVSLNVLNAHGFQTELTKGHKSVKLYFKLWFLILHISDHAFYLYHVVGKISKGFRVIEQIRTIYKGE